jgi:hypothetical protein
MNPRIQNKINQFKKIAATQKAEEITLHSENSRTRDGLTQAIRTKKDADIFMAELKMAIEKAQ